MNYDTMTIGRWPARSMTTNKIAVSSSAYRVLFTRGDELVTPPNYRSTFDLSLERALGSSANVTDEAMARAFAASATAYACTEYAANIISNIPLMVTDGNENELENTELTYFLNNSEALMINIVRGLLLWGRVYLEKQRNAAGWPTGLKWINPLTVREVKGYDNRIIHYSIERANRSRENVSVDEIVYFQLFDTDPFGLGISKFEAAFRAIGVEQSIVTYAAAFFVNSAQPDGFLTFDTPLQQEQIEDARNEWRSNFKGVTNAHKTAVMPGGARWTPMQSVPKDLAMVELKDSERQDIAAIFGVDLMLIGLQVASDPLSANSTYNSAEVAFLRRQALPLLNALILPALNKQWASKNFSQPYTLAIEYKEIEALNESYLTKAETSNTLTSAAILDYDEGRELIGFEERGGYYRRNTTEALANWQAGTITLGQYHKLVGTPDINPTDLNLNVININGQLLPYTSLMQIALKNADSTMNPPPPPASPFGAIGGGQQPPQLPSGDVKPPADNKPPELPPTMGTDAPNVPVLPQQRAGMPLTVGISFADNQFVRYARRDLSKALTDQNVNAMTWTPDNEWKIDLASADSWTPNAVSSLLRNADYTETRKLDLRAAGYEYRDNAVYLVIEGDLSGFQKALALDTSTAQINAKNAGFIGVRMCAVDKQPDSLPSADWPLVANNLTVYLGSSPYHQWNLRGVSAAQTKELAAWRKVIANKGVTHVFKPDALTGHPISRFLQDALSCEVEEAERGEWVASVFETAEKWLKSDSVRAYADTRDQFYSDILSFIRDAQANDINRANFAGRLRAALRRYGLIAFRDGMNDAGYDPESFNADELAAFRGWQSEQSGYVSNFGAEIFKQGITENEVATRASMWTNKSLDTVYYLGLGFGAPNKLYTWILGETEHCHTCLSQAGKSRTMKDWQATVMPRSSALDCGGFNCQCKLVAV